MNKSLLLTLAAAMALICLAAPMAALAPTPAQEKPADTKKLLAEIIGDYEFSTQDQTLLVQFTEADGKLFGAPPGQDPEEIRPVAGKPLCFDITLASSGDYYELQFLRTEKGVIDKCIMTVKGMVIEGAKIIK